MKSPWPKVRLGEVLQRSEETVALQPDVSYREVTVKLWGKGAILRGIVTGAEIASSRRFVARAGQFILSRIDARNGAIGIVPKELDGAVVTNDFPLFAPDPERVDSAFLGWLGRTRGFVELCIRASEGTTNRVRLQEDLFLALEIPLPPLAEQRRIVARIEELAAQIAEARTLRQQAAEEAEALTAAIQSTLSRSQSPGQISVGDLVGGSGLKNGRSVKPTDSESEIRCLVLSSMRNGRIDVRDSKPVPMSHVEAAPFRVRRGDVYIIRGNGSKVLCGRAGLVTDEMPGVVFPDLFIQVALPRDRVLPEFFVAAWNSSALRSVIEEKARTTSGIWKINQGHIFSTRIPVPPLPEQRRIVAELDALQMEVDALKRLQAESAAELDALLPAILDRAFKGEL